MKTEYNLILVLLFIVSSNGYAEDDNQLLAVKQVRNHLMSEAVAIYGEVCGRRGIIGYDYGDSFVTICILCAVELEKPCEITDSETCRLKKKVEKYEEIIKEYDLLIAKMKGVDEPDNTKFPIRKISGSPPILMATKTYSVDDLVIPVKEEITQKYNHSKSPKPVRTICELPGPNSDDKKPREE